MTAGQDLRERREALVREHMKSENHHDFEVTLGTFGHPRYEIVPTGDVFDGEEAVIRYFEDSRTAFPDQRNASPSLRAPDPRQGRLRRLWRGTRPTRGRGGARRSSPG